MDRCFICQNKLKKNSISATFNEKEYCLCGMDCVKELTKLFDEEFKLKNSLKNGLEQVKKFK